MRKTLKKKTEQFAFIEETLHLEKMEYLRNIEVRIYYILHILHNCRIYKMHSPVKSCVTNLWRIFQSMY